MDEEAIQDAFTLFTGAGYKGDIQGFKTLISSNDEARNDAFSLFAKSGYKGDVQGFSNLMGVSKKKEQVDSTVSPLVSAQDKLDLGIPEPQKETTLDSQPLRVTEPEDGKLPQLLTPIEPIVGESIFNQDIVNLYDQYKEAGIITTEQEKAIQGKLTDQREGDRGFFEIAGAYVEGVLRSPASLVVGGIPIVPLFNFNSEQDLLQQRTVKNRTNFLEALPNDRRQELNAYAVNRTIALNKENTNALAENSVLEEKAKSLVATLNQMRAAIKELQSSGKAVPQYGIDTYIDTYDELIEISKTANTNIDTIESNKEDIGDFAEELDLLKRNYRGLEYYKDLARLSTADMISGGLEIAASVGTLLPIPLVTEQFSKEFREEIERQRGFLKPPMSVTDIDTPLDFGNWLAEQTAMQLPTLTVLLASGGTAGVVGKGAGQIIQTGALASIAVPAGGQKIGELKDIREESIKSIKVAREQLKDPSISSQEKVQLERQIESISIPAERDNTSIYFAGIGVMASEFFTERVSLGILSKGRRSFEAARKSAFQPSIRSGIKEFSKKAFERAVGAPASEALSEFGNNVVQNGIDIIWSGDTDKHFLDNSLDVLASGGAMGFGMRNFPSVIGLTSGAFMHRTTKTEVIDRARKIEEILSELDDKEGSLSDTSKELLKNKVSELLKDNNTSLEEAFDRVSKLEKSQIQELIELDKKSNNLLVKAKDVESSTLSPELKQELLQGLKVEADILTEQKNKILEDGDKQKPEVTEEPTAKEPVTPEEVVERRERVEEVPREDAVQPSVVEPSERVQPDITKAEEITPEPPTATVEEFTKIDLSDKLGLDKALETLNKWDKDLGDFGKETIGVNIPVVVAQGVVKAMKVAIKTAKTGADIISAGINHLRGTDWYKGLNQKDKIKAEENLIDNISSISEPVKVKKEVPLRTKIEAKVGKKIEEGVSEKKIIESFEDSKERMIAKDIFARKSPLSIEDAKKAIKVVYKKSINKLKQTDKTETRIERAFNKFMQFKVDRQFLPKKLLKKASGEIVRNYIITSKGAGGYAKYLFDKAYKKIYKGVSDENLETLNMIITLKRFISIDKNRAKRSLPDVVHSDFMNKQRSEAALEGLKKELGEKDFKDLEKRASAYFTEYKENLQRMVESGLVSKEIGETFLDVDYQPRDYLDFLNQIEQDLPILEKGAKERASLSSPQIKSLEEGSDKSLLMDSAYLLGRSINITAKSVAMNETTKKFVDFYTKRIVEIDKLRSKNNPTKQDLKDISNFDKLSKHIKTPKEGVSAIIGFKPQFYYIDGVKKRIFFKDTFYNQYNDLVKGIVADPTNREIVSLLSFTSLLKTIATGNNPTFFLTNTPRDLVFVSTFSPEYGSFVPLNMVKVAVDAFKGIKDIRSDSKNYENFVKYGGMLDFLHRQGQFKETTTSRKMFKRLFSSIQLDNMKSIISFLSASKVQMWSEMGFRMGIFNRNVSNQFKKLDVKTEEALIEKYGDKSTQMLKDIYTTATASARSITDFNQGGITAKDIDLVVPYYNPGIQGTRVVVESLADRPLETSVRMVQSAAIVGAVTVSVGLYVFSKAFRNEDDEDWDLSAIELYLKARGGLSRYEKINYMIFFTGKRTEDGEFKYRRIAKSHFLTPISSYATDLQENIMRGIVGEPLKSRKEIIKDVLFALEKNVSPTEMSISGNIAKTPLFKAALTYQIGYDFFREQDLSHLKGKVLPQVEGFENKNIEGFYKNIGEKWDISPARLKGAVEGIITTPSTSPFIGALYGGLEHLVGGDFKKGVFSETMLKSISGRIFKETSKFNRRKKLIPDNELAEMQKRDIFTKEIIKDMTKKLLSKEISSSELTVAIEKRAEGSPFEAKRIVNIMKSVVKNPKTLPYIYEIKFSPPRVRAVMLVTLFGDTLLDESKEVSKFNKKLRDELYSKKVLNSETLFEYNNLIKAKESN